jgi:hypothetical protein
VIGDMAKPQGTLWLTVSFTHVLATNEIDFHSNMKEDLISQDKLFQNPISCFTANNL